MTLAQIGEACQKYWIVHGMEEGQNGCLKCSRSIGRHGSMFSLDGAPGPHLIIDMDRIQSLSNKQRCDYIFTAGRANGEVTWIVPIEITSSKGKKVGDALGQIQSGAKFAECTFGPVNSAEFRPVLVGNVRGWNAKVSYTIKYFNVPYAVKKIRNGGKLADALRED